MKFMKLTLVVLGICLLGLFAGGCEVSSSASFDPSYESTALLANSIFKKFDKNGDGFLTEQEFNNLSFRNFVQQNQRDFERFNKRLDKMNNK